MPMIEGMKVKMGGVEWTIPPLTLGALRRLRLKLTSLKDFEDGLPTDEQFATIIEVIHTALRRNYPDVTLEQVSDELVDAGNMPDVLKATMTASGMAGVPQGEVGSRSLS